MGLDMFLEKHTYVGRFDEELGEIVGPVTMQGVEGVDWKRVRTIVEEVGYWRKANAIHAWFVRECAGGVDDCQPVYVPNEKLHELLSVVEGVLANPATGPRDLPTQSGFFFGGTEYDEWYVKDLQDTKQILEEALKDKEADFYYRASW